MTDSSGTSPDGRTLVLLRHAQAEPSGPAGDADRPLTARGHADAAAAGAWLGHGGHLPAVVICSPAKRTRQTWHEVALGMAAPPARPVGGVASGGSGPAWPDGQPAGHPGSPVTTANDAPSAVPVVRYEPLVYRGSADDLLNLVRATDPAARTVLLVGHNPSISRLSMLLDPVHAAPDGLTTCGIAIHRVTGAWTDVGPEAGPIVKWHTARG